MGYGINLHPKGTNEAQNSIRHCNRSESNQIKQNLIKL